MVSERLSLTFSRNTGFLLNLEILEVGARGNRCEIRQERLRVTGMRVDVYFKHDATAATATTIK